MKVSERKIAANRRNAAKSTGPKTAAGKSVSRWNALKFGLWAREVVISGGRGREDSTEFQALLAQLEQDLQPVGILEQMQVERIAVCYWRLKRAARAEVGEIRKRIADDGWVEEDELDTEDDSELEEVPPHLNLPDTNEMNKILRYENSTNRQLQQAINQLERLQRRRKGAMVARPMTVEMAG